MDTVCLGGWIGLGLIIVGNIYWLLRVPAKYREMNSLVKKILR